MMEPWAFRSSRGSWHCELHLSSCSEWKESHLCHSHILFFCSFLQELQIHSIALVLYRSRYIYYKKKFMMNTTLNITHAQSEYTWHENEIEIERESMFGGVANDIKPISKSWTHERDGSEHRKVALIKSPPLWLVWCRNSAWRDRSFGVWLFLEPWCYLKTEDINKRERNYGEWIYQDTSEITDINHFQ